MKKLMIVLLVLLPWTGHAAEILPKAEKISKHVYAWIGPYGGPNKENKGFRMNLAFVVGGNSIAVLDSGFYPQMAQSMIRRIREVSPLPIRYVINTNSQPHRYFGNKVFQQQGATILAHEKEIARMRENANMQAMFIEQNQGFPKDSLAPPPLPTIAIKHSKTLDLGAGVKLILHSNGSAHTPAPLLVEIPKDKIIYAGDVLYSGRMLAIVSGGNIKQWLQYENWLQKFSRYTFVPGHGKPGKLSAFTEPTFNYLKMLQGHMAKMLDNGIELMEAVEKLNQGRFKHLANYKELAGRNANRAYLEFEKEYFN